MNRLWGGRFHSDIHLSALEYTHTVDIDQRLLISDIWNNIAHVMMLGVKNIISSDECRSILKCLLNLYDDAIVERFQLDKKFEDVHLNIEHKVISELGIDVGGKINTARSRNDQIVTDTRLFLRDKLLEMQKELLALINILLNKAKFNLEKIFVGYTHGQPAQPVSVAFWLTAYASMFMRDFNRLSEVFERTNKSPLGSCALGGTSFDIDRQLTSKLLGFRGIVLHCLDATSSRDFIIEALGAMSITMSNISKLAEEIILFSSFEFGLVKVDDSFATGSSIMPQKKNPVIAELARAKCGRVFGSLINLLTIVKGVPMGYSCDLQEDKPPLWRAVDDTISTIVIMGMQISHLTFNHQRAIDLCWSNFSSATELANFLVKEKNLSFRKAHKTIGKIVNNLIKHNKSLADVLALSDELQKEGFQIEIEQLRETIDPTQVINKQVSQGSTSVKSVENIIDVLNKQLYLCQKKLKKELFYLQKSFENTKKAATMLVNGLEIRSVMKNLYKI